MSAHCPAAFHQGLVVCKFMGHNQTLRTKILIEHIVTWSNMCVAFRTPMTYQPMNHIFYSCMPWQSCSTQIETPLFDSAEYSYLHKTNEKLHPGVHQVSSRCF